MQLASEMLANVGTPDFRTLSDAAYPHTTRGEFRPWFRRHFALSCQSAAAYMKLARRMSGNVKPPDFRTLSGVAYPHKKTPPWQQPVREEVRAVDVGALAAV